MISNIFTSMSGRDRSHLGDQGELWFATALPHGWVWQPPRRDFGKDGLIVIRDGTRLHNIEFSVQIKTSTRPTVRDGCVLLAGISRASVQYWFASPLPTLIVAVDITKRTAWYTWHLDLFDTPEELFGPKTKTLTLRIPQKNQLDNAGWHSIRTDLQNHVEALQRAVFSDTVSCRLLAAINNITRITGNLLRIGANGLSEFPLTSEEEMTLIIEQVELRDLIWTVQALLQRIVEDSDAHKQITFWLSSFEEIAIEAYPRLQALPPKGQNIPAGFEFAVTPKRLLEARPLLVLAAVDLVKLLTSPPLVEY